MAKYQIVVNRINEDGTTTPWCIEDKEPGVVECDGFCIIGHTEMDGHTLASQCMLHDTTLNNLVVTMRNYRNLKLAALELVRSLLGYDISRLLEEEQHAAE